MTIKKCVALMLCWVALCGCTPAPSHHDGIKQDQENINEAQKKMQLFHRIVFMEDKKQEAEKLAKQACELGLGEGCIFSVFGDTLTQIDDHTEDAKRIFREHQERIEQEQLEMDKKAFVLGMKNCQNHIGSECAIVGGIYERGDGVDRDLKLALKFYTQACDLNAVQGCLDLNRLQGNGGKHDPKLFEKTIGLLQQDCLNDDPFLCYLSGEWHVIKALRRHPKGKAIDSEELKQARGFYEKACDLGFNPETLGLEGSCEENNVWQIRVDLIHNGQKKSLGI